jgi:YVTN family beta-propeller protein
VPEPPPVALLARPSRSTAVDLSPDDSLAAMVNTDDGSLSVFSMTPGGEARLSKTRTSANSKSEPFAVVIHPDGKRAFVANRATGTVSVISGIDTAQASLGREVEVGAEPVGLALSPTGARLFVADWVGGTVTVLTTENLQVERTIAVGGNPYALAITHDGDEDDSDEKVFVAQFFGRAEGREGVDDGRKGIVQVIPLGGAQVSNEIELAPLASCFTNMVNGAELTSGCYPNQLASMAIHTAFGKTRLYVVSTAAAPAGPINFSHNMQALVSVVDVETEQEEPALARNLNALIRDQVDNDGDDNQGRRFLNVPNGIDFVPDDGVAIGYVSSAGSDIVLRVQYAEDGSVAVGSPMGFNIPVGQNPQGIVVRRGQLGSGALVANLISRDLSLVSFRDQRQEKVVVSSDQPQNPASAEFKVWRGKRFFNTSTGIWSREGWGSCVGCHPLGLTDNVTWKFGAGPRQTVSMDGQYASNDPSDMRALNWTAIFDETHDFELNTRGVSGGKGTFQKADGAVIVSPMGPPLSAIVAEDGVTSENHQALNGSTRFLSQTGGICSNAMTCPDFELVDEYVKTIRSPRAKTPTQAEGMLIAQGRAIFQDAGCDKCHAGPKWTVSRTFYEPDVFSGALPTRVFETNAAFMTAMDPTGLLTLPMNTNTDTTLVAGDDSDGGMPALKRQACNVRDVGTFGAMGGAEETRDNNTPAQGRKGYNVPSLLGLSTGAPYLHNGAAKNLTELFEARFSRHTTAGNPNFNPDADDIRALVAFLLSVDEQTAPFAILPDTVLCPTEE